MAVFTPVSKEDVSALVRSCNLGEVVNIVDIPQGVENSNFHLYTTTGHFILTLFEGRTDLMNLSFYFDFMDHIRRAGIPCPAVMVDQIGQRVQKICGKPSAILSFLEGQGVVQSGITPDLCRQMGDFCARLHKSGATFEQERKNTVSVPVWSELVDRCCKTADSIEAGLSTLLISERQVILESWSQTKNLPRGAVHTDLFPDNVFIDKNGKICGVIDFYFSCTDMFVYDMAIAFNAWCFTGNHQIDPERVHDFFAGYQAIRPLESEEKNLFQSIARAAAFRFLLTRLYDLIHRPVDALVFPKDPLEYVAKLEFHRENRVF